MSLKEKQGLSVQDMVVVGFALFSMFFGAGNTVFPPYIGMESGDQWFAGFLMFFIGDCGLALMGCFALLRMGSTEAVFNRIGKTVGTVLVAICLLCVGPFIAVPRTAATTYELGIAPNISGIPTALFSVIFFAIVLALTIKETAVVDIVGKILTPLLLLGLAIIIIMGIFNPIGDITAAQIDNVLGSGLKNGYQTLDAIGAVPTGLIALQSIMAKGYSKKKETATMAGASILCGVLLLEPLFSGGKIMFHAHGGTLPSASMNVRISFHDYSIACARAQPSLDEWGRLCYNFREERRAP